MLFKYLLVHNFWLHLKLSFEYSWHLKMYYSCFNLLNATWKKNFVITIVKNKLQLTYLFNDIRHSTYQYIWTSYAMFNKSSKTLPT